MRYSAKTNDMTILKVRAGLRPAARLACAFFDFIATKKKFAENAQKLTHYKRLLKREGLLTPEQSREPAIVGNKRKANDDDVELTSPGPRGPGRFLCGTFFVFDHILRQARSRASC